MFAIISVNTFLVVYHYYNRVYKQFVFHFARIGFLDYFLFYLVLELKKEKENVLFRYRWAVNLHFIKMILITENKKRQHHK